MDKPSFVLFSEPHIVIPASYREEILSTLAYSTRMMKKSAKRKKRPQISQLPTLPTIPKIS